MTLNRRLLPLLALAVLPVAQVDAQVVNSEWNTGNAAWNVAANWSPIGVPNNSGTFTYNVQIGNRAIAVNAGVTFIPASGTSATIETLIMSGGADLFTNGYQLTTNGLVTITGAGSTIRVDLNNVLGTPSVQFADLDVTTGGALQMNGGIANVTADLDITATGVLSGFGRINVGNVDLVAQQAFQNSGLIQVVGTALSPGTLTIHANGLDTIDLDGDNEIGHIDVSNVNADLEADTLTLIVDGPLSDGLGALPGGLLEIGQRDTVTFNQNFTIDAGFAITMDGGNNIATLNGPGAITSITGAAFTITNNALISNNMTFSGTANTVTIVANASLELAGTVLIPDASALVLAASTSTLIISGNTTINEAAGDFNWDGPFSASTIVTGTGQLNLTVNHIDTGDDFYNGTLTLNDDGDVSVNNAANLWTMAGTLNKNNAGISSVTGDSVNVTGIVNVNAGTLTMPTSTLSSGAALTINGVMTLGGGSVLAGPTSITGTGLLRMNGTSTVTANTTIATASFDWDGLGSGTLHTISDGVTFTINSTTWDADDAGDMDDPINIGGNGAVLAVNNVPSWTMTRTLTTNTSVLGITSLNGNSRMILSGATAIWNANGQTAVNAPVTFGASSVANIAAAGFIRLNGGDTINNPNRIEGATINGPGGLLSINTHLLRGFGTINAPITFQNSSSLLADDGTLAVNGAINQVFTIGTGDTDGILNVANAWNSNVATNVILNGGQLQGGAITVANTNGIVGNGLVTARVVNNTRLQATTGTLIFQTAANDNDWDGASNTALLAATNGSTLELDDNATFTFGGNVTATGSSTVYAKGFGMNFGAAAILNLTSSTFKADESSEFNGPITVGAGGDSTINVQVNRFLTIRSTVALTLNANLNLVSNNGSIEAGATFSGPGAVVVPQGSHLILEANSNVNTLVINNGTIHPTGFNTVGRVDVRDYQQGHTGSLVSEIAGTNLNQFDRVVVNGNASIDGDITLDIDGGFVPALGQTFDILSASAGVSGSIYSINQSGVPNNLFLDAAILPNAVRISVVARRIWDDSSNTAQWSTANNWADNIEPLAPDAVLFPGLIPNGVSTINLSPGETALALEFDNTYTLNGGSLTIKGNHPLIIVGINTVTMNSALTVNGPLILSGQGMLAINPSSLTTPSVSLGNFSRMKLLGTNNALTAPITIAFDARLDVASSALIVATTGGADKTSRIAALMAQITSGKNGGNWNGNGITSSTVAADPTHLTVALADNADLQLASFHGQPVNNNSLIVTAARFGDATLDGKVDALDLNLLAAHWQQPSNALWSAGDFTGDGKVDALDLNLLAANWQFGTPIEAALASFPQLTAVPEPATLAILLLGVSSLVQRRKPAPTR